MMILRLFLLILMLSDNVKAVSGPNGSNGLVVVEEAYLNWVKQMGSLSQKTKKPNRSNKFKTCLRVKVNKNPKRGDFVTVQDAINSLPLVNKCRAVVFISSGTYMEKVEIPASKAYITLRGSGADKTVIEWGDTADKMGPNGRPLGTFGSATFAVNSPYFIAKNITFKNKAGKAGSGKVGKQAVALRISGDTSAFRGCKFVGGQDTLYDHMGRHYFKDCYIEGSVDFVFGNGLSLYKDCHLHAISSSYGALTAQKRESFMEETGFSFVNCKVTGSGALYLGRAWGTFSRVVFAYTYMDDIITPKGWYDWGDRNRDMTVYFGQYKCYGPGSNFGGRVAWSRELTQQEAKPFIGLDFIDGYKWLFHKH